MHDQQELFGRRACGLVDFLREWPCSAAGLNVHSVTPYAQEVGMRE